MSEERAPYNAAPDQEPETPYDKFIKLSSRQPIYDDDEIVIGDQAQFPDGSKITVKLYSGASDMVESDTANVLYRKICQLIDAELDRRSR